MASLPFLLENLYGRRRPLEVLAPRAVLATLRRHLFNDAPWPDFTRLPSRAASDARSTARSRQGRTFRAGGLTRRRFAVDHLVPTFGYVVSKPGRAVALFRRHEADGAALGRGARARDLKAIFLEVSFSDTQAEVARASCHLTPRQLPEELAKAPRRVPVYLYHMKPPSLSRIRREVAALDEPRLWLLEAERSFRF